MKLYKEYKSKEEAIDNLIARKGLVENLVSYLEEETRLTLKEANREGDLLAFFYTLYLKELKKKIKFYSRGNKELKEYSKKPKRIGKKNEN